MSKQWRQGNLLLEGIEADRALEIVLRKKNKIGYGHTVLARDDENGNVHLVDVSRAIVAWGQEDNGEDYLIVPRGVTIEYLNAHWKSVGKYSPLILAGGVYRIIRNGGLSDGGHWRGDPDVDALPLSQPNIHRFSSNPYNDMD